MLSAISILSGLLGAVSFCLFVFLVLSKPSDKPKQPADLRLDGSLEDMAKLIEALAKLTDSLQKAGPMIASLVGAIFFLLLAALTAGLAK